MRFDLFFAVQSLVFEMHKLRFEVLFPCALVMLFSPYVNSVRKVE